MKTRLLFACCVALSIANAAHGAESCDTLRAQIESKIGAQGVQNFAVTVVDTDAQVPGQIVGACEFGTKKIVYSREGASYGTATGASAGTGVAAAPSLPGTYSTQGMPGAPVTSAAAPPVAGARRSAPMLTECRDGSVSLGGDCR